MTEKLSIRDLDLNNKRALIRVDFNVPMEHGKITDDSRIRESVPTIEYVLDHGGSVILLSHLGRPDGIYNSSLSLKPCGDRLAKLLQRPVQFATDCCSEEAKKKAKELHPGQILLLENLRFHKGEEKPQQEPTFVSSLANLGDVYINDAFGTAHRAHASTTAIAEFFPGKAATGFLIEKEIMYLGKTLINPKPPFVAILGGAKISTKFKVIEALMQKADILLIGGAMTYTFFKADNIPVGDSLVENDFVAVARELIDVSSQSKCRLLLPVDSVASNEIKAHANYKIFAREDGIPNGMKGVDIGPTTVEIYAKEIRKASTVFWNGPLGVFECPPFDEGTNQIAKVIAGLGPSVTTIVGGGDSVAAIEHAKVRNKFSHISTGGGASLEYIEFGQLPGVEALSDKTLTAHIK